jgi:hypothetical protein
MPTQTSTRTIQASTFLTKQNQTSFGQQQQPNHLTFMNTNNEQPNISPINLDPAAVAPTSTPAQTPTPSAQMTTFINQQHQTPTNSQTNQITISNTNNNTSNPPLIGFAQPTTISYAQPKYQHNYSRR